MELMRSVAGRQGRSGPAFETSASFEKWDPTPPKQLLEYPGFVTERASVEMHLGIWAAAVPRGRWRLDIGDLSLVGWLTVAAYFATAALCARAAWIEGRSPAAMAPRAANASKSWWILASALLMLGVNKQLDILSSLANLGRNLAREQQWYGARQVVQMASIAAILLVASIALIASSWYFRHADARRRLAIAGLGFLLAFVMVRATSLHHVDAFINGRILGIRWNWIFELGGIALIAASAVSHRRAFRPPPSPPPPTDGPDDHQGPRTYRIPGY